MPAINERLVVGALWILLGGGFAVGQTKDTSSTEQESAGQTPKREEKAEKREMNESTSLDVSAPPKTERSFRPNFLGEFLYDQKDLWTSPARLRFSDTE